MRWHFVGPPVRTIIDSTQYTHATPQSPYPASRHVIAPLLIQGLGGCSHRATQALLCLTHM